jgi:hypothetical protein
LFAVWIRIDETLPWIEAKGEYQTKSEASRAAKQALKAARIKVVNVSEKRAIKTLVAART